MDLTVGILAITAAIVLWYTVETFRIRRRADEDARRRNVPVLTFNVDFRDGKNSTLDVRFHVANRTDRLAIIRPTIRLHLGDDQVIGLQHTTLYSGNEDWEVWAHDEWDGHFPLVPAIDPSQAVRLSEVAERGARPGPTPYSRGPAPIESFQLDVQVAVYNGKGEFQYLYRREHHVEIKYRTEFYQSWPEIAPRSIPQAAPYSNKLVLGFDRGVRDLL